MLEMTKRGISLIGEAYQTSFDNLRDEISNKVELSDLDTILLADFIQFNNLNKGVALANLKKDNAKPLVNCLKKAESLRTVCLWREDITILDKIRRDDHFSTHDLEEIIEYASGSGSIGRGIMSVRSACAHFEEELTDAVRDCLTFVWEDD